MRFRSTLALSSCLVLAVSAPAFAQSLDEVVGLHLMRDSIAACTIAVDAADQQLFGAMITIVEADAKHSPAAIAKAKTNALEAMKGDPKFCDEARKDIPTAIAEMKAEMAKESRRASPKTTAVAAASNAKAEGFAAVQAILGKTLVGSNEGQETFDYYMANGSVKSMEDGEISSGKWSIEANKFCVKFPDDDKSCYKISITGDQVTMYEPDGTGYRFRAVEGNSKGL